MRRTRLILLAIAGGVLPVTACAQLSLPYFKEVRNRVLMPGLVNFKLAPGVALDQLTLGIPDAQVDQHHIPGWYQLRVQGADQRQIAAALARNPQIEFVSPTVRDRNNFPQFFENELYVSMNDGAAAADVLGSEHLTGTVVDRKFAPNLYKVHYNGKNGFELIDATLRLSRRNDVKMATPTTFATGRPWLNPNDPMFANQWNLFNNGQFGGEQWRWVDINVKRAWDVTTGAPGVGILLLDDGIDRTHPDLNIAGTANFMPDGTVDGSHVYDPNLEFHGTWVAGIISAKLNNSTGVAGVAPNCSLYSARVHSQGLASDGSNNGFFFMYFENTAVLNGLLWGLNQGCRVSNNSNSYATDDPLVLTGYQVARGNGMVNFCAAGNQGAVTAPATYVEVNSVTGIDWMGRQSGDTGTDIDFCAPGVLISSTDPKGDLNITGDNVTTGVSAFPPFFPFGLPADICSTSFASAHVAAIAGLVLSVNPTLGPDEVETILKQTARDGIDWDNADDPRYGYDDVYGWGYPNATLAVAAAGVGSISVTPTSVVGGKTSVCKIDLLFPGLPDPGLVIPIISANASVLTPRNESIVIVSPARSGTDTLDTVPVDADTVVDVKGFIGNEAKTVKVTVLAADLSSLSASKTTFIGGNTVTGTVRLNGNAGPSGTAITLKGSHAAATPPASVTVAAGRNSATFPIVTKRVTSNSDVVIRATLREVTKEITLRLRPAPTDIQWLAISPLTVPGGTPSNASLTMTNAAPFGGARITIADNSSVATSITSLTIPQGSSTGGFAITTSKTGSQSVATFVATYEGKSKTATLTITPTIEIISLSLNPLSVRGGFSTTGRAEVYSFAPAGGTRITLLDGNGYADTPASATVPEGAKFVDFTVTTKIVKTTQTVRIYATVGTVTKTATFSIVP